MNCDRANLRRCSYTHIGAEQPNAGGDDIVHLPLFEDTFDSFANRHFMQRHMDDSCVDNCVSFKVACSIKNGF